MTPEILVKYVHFLCIFLIVGALVGEHLLLQPTLTRAQIKRLGVLDSIYGFSVIVLLAAGFTLWFGVGKPAEFYSANPIFHAKLGLFALIGILSAYPTIFFMRQRKGDPEEVVELPPVIKGLIRAELFLLFLMPLLASLMAKGVGL